MLFILYILYQLVSAQKLPSNSLSTLHGHREYEGLIGDGKKVKLEFTCRHPFELHLYTSDGIPLHFIGNKITYTGKPTYFRIKLLNNRTSTVALHIQLIETDYLKIAIYAIFAISGIFVLIILKRDHIVSQIILVSLLLIRLYNTSDYEKTANEIVKKILF